MCGANHTTFKSYMDYRCVTSIGSAQYKLIHSDQVTVGSDGLLYCGEYIGAAIGSRYGSVGDKFILTMSDGRQVKIISLDEKADKDTVDNCHHRSDGSLVEFVINTNGVRNAYPMAIKMGNLDYIPKLSGNVVKIQKVLN